MKLGYLTLFGSLSGLLVAGSTAVGTEPLPIEPSHQLAQSQPLMDSLAMTPTRLEAIIEEEGTNVRSQGNQWQLDLENRSLLVLVNEERDRMRIFTPVIPATELTSEQVGNTLIANFHTTLDARYAVTDGTLVSVFVHPLSSLQEEDLRSALHQVASLANNFGTTYSSEEVIFGPTRQPSQEQQPFEVENEVGI